MASQTVDDVIATVMMMGFDIGDCQEAVQYGKITAEEIVEWIVAGKPGLTSHPTEAPRLQLGRTQPSTGTTPLQMSSNPFVSPITVPPPSTDVVSTGSPAKTCRENTEDDTVVSRHHLTDEKRRDKELFEEKKREEAKRKAREEKIAQRKEKERILQQIAEDRDEKLKKEKQHVSSSSSTTSACSSNTNTATSNVPTVSQPLDTSATLQIRLPGGRSLRKKFEVTTTLNSVWDYVYSECKAITDMIFMQPFPRLEFTQEDMIKNLKELGLTPTGCLVLKPKTVTEQPVEATPAADEAEESDYVEQPMEQEESIRSRLRPRHQWGQGHRLEDDEEFHEEMDVGEEREEDFAEFANANFPGGNFPGMPFMQMNEMNQPFGGQGHRLLPPGHPDADVVQNRPAAQVAAEAALHRLQHPAPIQDVPSAPHDTHELFKPIKSLLTMVFQNLADQLNDPKQQLKSLAGMSEDLAQKLLAYLMDKNLLESRTLRAFIPCYLRKLVLDFYPLTTNELLLSVRLHSNLSLLSLNSCSLITDNGLQSIAGMKKLKNLNLSSCKQLTNKSLIVLKELPSLQSLNLMKTGVTDNGVTLHVVPHCPQLQHLNLNSTSVTHNIIPHLKGLTELKTLLLEDTQVCSLSGIQHLAALQQLNISHTDIFTDSLLCLAYLPNLSSLNISATDRVEGDLALQYLSGLKLQNIVLPSRHTTTNQGMAYLTGFPLVSLDLTNYINVGNEGIKYIGQIHSLKKLLLSNTKISDQGLLSLKDCVNLEVLYLDRTNVTDEGATIVKDFPMLGELSLSDTRITSEFIRRGVINACKSLVKLSLSKNNITESGLVCLKSNSLEILNLGETNVAEGEIERIQQILRENCPHLVSFSISRAGRNEGEEEPMV